MSFTNHATLFNNYSLPSYEEALERATGGKVCTVVEYVWIDGSGKMMRSKSRTLTLDSDFDSLEQVPEWNYDGSSCYQAVTHNSEIILKPVALFADPFRGGNCKLVLCESFAWSDGSFAALKPANSNFRHYMDDIEKATKSEDPLINLQQQYSMLSRHTSFQKQPLGWPTRGYPSRAPESSYCGVGCGVSAGRPVIEKHAQTCLAAGVKIHSAGMNDGLGSGFFEVGPCTPTEAGDHLWMARYILQRIGEDFNVAVSFAPKLLPSYKVENHCLARISTISSRATGP